MEAQYTTGTWKAIIKDGKWEIHNSDNKKVASVNQSSQEKDNARLIAASPMMLEALSALVQLIGEDDLPDNGELSGAAICDLARSAVAVATGNDIL